jgi:hypothetical protein
MCSSADATRSVPTLPPGPDAGPPAPAAAPAPAPAPTLEPPLAKSPSAPRFSDAPSRLPGMKDAKRWPASPPSPNIACVWENCRSRACVARTWPPPNLCTRAPHATHTLSHTGTHSGPRRPPTRRCQKERAPPYSDFLRSREHGYERERLRPVRIHGHVVKCKLGVQRLVEHRSLEVSGAAAVSPQHEITQHARDRHTLATTPATGVLRTLPTMTAKARRSGPTVPRYPVRTARP